MLFAYNFMSAAYIHIYSLFCDKYNRLKKVHKQGVFFLQFWEGALGPFRLGKVAW